MTKTKHNITLVISLILAIAMLASIFACASFHTPQTVDATETREPGLYETGATTPKTTWAELLSSGKIKTTDGYLMVVDKTLAGELVCDSVENLTDLASAFANCTGLTYINVDKLDTKNVESMNYMFYNCTSLKEISLKNFDTSKTRAFYAMFAGTKLTTLDISSFSFGATQSDYLQNVMGMIGLDDDYCLNVLFQNVPDESAWDYGQSKDYASIYRKAMNNQSISEQTSWDADLDDSYSSAIEGKSGDELGKISRIYTVVCFMYYEWGYDFNDAIENTEMMFNTEISNISIPATMAGVKISLPYLAETYVAKSGSTEKTLESQFLYGYSDLSMESGAMLTAKTAEVENTGVVLDTKTIIIACAIAGACVLAIIAVVLNKVYKANKRKNRKF